MNDRKTTSERRVLVLMLATFAAGTEGYVYAGLLSDLASDLDVTIGRAGLLAACFAITYAVLVAPLAAVTSGLPRRGVLVAGLLILGAINLLAALAATFEWLLASRVACGVVAAFIGPSATAAAAALVPPERRGRAMGLVGAGLSLAFTLGVPLGSAIGGVFGWRSTFVFAGILLFVCAGLIRLVLPPVPLTDTPGLTTLKVGLRPEIAARLAITAAAFTATFASIAYLGPIANRVVGAQGAGVGMFQACIGLGSVIGVLAGGRLADQDRPDRFLPWIFLVIATTQLGFFVAQGAALPLLSAGTLIAGSIFVGASALFALIPVLQVILVSAATNQRNVVLALNGAMVFLGQGLGAALGGAVSSIAGIAFTGVAGALLAGTVAITMPILASRHTRSSLARPRSLR
jgi:predicted MFS family arabinose efflux permease